MKEVKNSIGKIFTGAVVSLLIGLFVGFVILAFTQSPYDTRHKKGQHILDLIIMAAVLVPFIINLFVQIYNIYKSIKERFSLMIVGTVIYCTIILGLLSYVAYSAHKHFINDEVVLSSQLEDNETNNADRKYQQINSSRERIRNTEKQEEIINFSDSLRSALGLNIIEEDFDITVGEYSIGGAHRCYGSWVTILEVRPKNMSHIHGFREAKQTKKGFEFIEQKNFPPKSWHYYFGGTTTEILPPPEIRQEILNLLNKK